MALLRFRQPKPRQFELKPRYYDEHKERIAESRKRVMQELGMEQEKPQSNSAQNLHGTFRDSLERTHAEKNAKMRFGLIIGACILIIYVLFYYAG